MSSSNYVRVREGMTPFFNFKWDFIPVSRLIRTDETLFSADIPRVFALKEMLAFDLIFIYAHAGVTRPL